MKTQGEIKALNESFAAKHGVDLSEVQQGSAAWLYLKLGVLSASNASKIVAKRDSETRNTYMCDLVAQIATGEVEEIDARALEWGKMHEAAARSSLEMELGAEIHQVPFIFRDSSFREGCSPDGLIEFSSGLELKCPFRSVNFIKFIADSKIKSEWEWQVQMSMRILGADQWVFGMYDPRMNVRKSHFEVIERDAKKQAQLEECVPQFLEDMDKMLANVGVAFGDQWKRKLS